MWVRFNGLCSFWEYKLKSKIIGTWKARVVLWSCSATLTKLWVFTRIWLADLFYSKFCFALRLNPHATFNIHFYFGADKNRKNTPFISSIIFIWVNKIPGLCCWCFQHILKVLEMISTHASDLWGNVQSFTIMCFSNIFHVSVWHEAPSACWFFLHRRGGFDSKSC